VRRIAVVGGGGGGKSSFARRLAAALDLPLVALDRLFWSPGWVPPDDDERWRHTVAELAAGPAWVMDGNHRATLDARVAAADLVVVVDRSPLESLVGVAVRRWRHRRGRPPRPDMAPGCPERVQLEYLRWVWRFRRRNLPRLLAELDVADQPFVMIRRDADADALLDDLAGRPK
jgi:adenylate kinase family enzyme